MTMKKLKVVSVLIFAIIGMSAVTMAQTGTPETAVEEKASTSSMTVKCTKGGCCGGTMLCCGNKASALQKSLEGVKGVSKVEVNPKTAEATVEYTGNLKEKDLNKAAEEAGFEVGEVTAKK